MPADHFDEPVAATYDDLSADMFAHEVLAPTVDVLTELVGPGGAALELAGTGRVALPLAERGVRVGLAGRIVTCIRPVPAPVQAAICR